MVAGDRGCGPNGSDGPAFVTLRELASVPAADGGRIRVLFLVPN